MRISHPLACTMLAAGFAAAQPPPTPTHSVTDTLHGVQITDPYRWLENQNSPETRAWLDAQIRYTNTFLSRIPIREKVKQRLEALSRIDSYGTPTARHGKYFYSRRLANENRSSICMRDGLNGPDQVLVNPADISKDESTSIFLADVTRDSRWMIYGVRKGGADEQELRILDLQTRKLLPDSLPAARYYGIALKHDKSGYFYSRYTTDVGSRVYYHAMGTPQASDREIFGQGHGADTIIEAEISQDGRYLLVTVAIGVPPKAVEVWVQDLQSGGPLQPIVKGIQAEFRPFIRGDRLYLWTNWNAPNWRILSVDLHNPARENWKEIVPESEWPIDRAAGVAGRLFVAYLENVQPHIKEYDPAGKSVGDLKLPGIGSAYVAGGNWVGDEVFFTFTSFVQPAAIYCYTPSNEREQVWYEPRIPFQPQDYQVRQVWYESKDKTRVPMFLVNRKGLEPDVKRPVLLTAYGGFSLSLTPHFSPTAAVWAEMGGVFALPNLRGGGEFGEKWHHAGMLEKKQNVFDDFIAAAEWLVANQYTQPRKIAIEGSSNGGLLVGAAVTQRPDLFGAALCGYPLPLRRPPLKPADRR